MNSASLHITWSVGPAQRLAGDTAALFLHQDATEFNRSMRSLQKSFRFDAKSLIEHGDFSGKSGEISVVYPSGSRGLKRILLVGLGERKKRSMETLRKAAGAAAKRARSLRSRSLVLWLPDAKTSPAETALALSEGAWLGLYRFDKYITKKKNGNDESLLHLHLASDRPTWKRVLPAATETAAIICSATTLARDLANAPGNEIHPESLAEAARASGERSGYTVTVWNEDELREHEMGGILAVGQGSVRGPRFMILEYGDPAKRPVVLVGKGVCFDSGGISIKPSAGMAEMKMDMSGAAAVIGTFDAVARLGINVHVIGLIPAVENMPSGSALKPGDIVRHHGGKTSEVDNTDAEGRLILADALAYADSLKPAAVIDLATLTGAVVVALGHVVTGMLGTDASLMDKLRKAGERTYERVWELPLYDEYERLIKSDVADVRNVGGRWAGTITGAMFLKKFIGSYPWVHLDIAGTAMMEETSEYVPKGGSGVGVRLLTEFLRKWK